MKRRMKRNESHPHKTVICKMCVTRRSGEGVRKRPYDTTASIRADPMLLKLSQECFFPRPLPGRAMLLR